MRYFKNASFVSELAAVAQGASLIALDFDGTLAPIVQDRSLAAMTPITARLVARVCQLFSVAIVTGRSRQDVLSRLGGAKVRHIVGNHGLEAADETDAYAIAIADTRRRVSQWAHDNHAIDIEDKTYSLSVHSQDARALERLACFLDSNEDNGERNISLVRGKNVLNIVLSNVPNKGHAVARLFEQGQFERALYVGDDETDEHVFSHPSASRWLTAHVGSNASQARYYLATQSEIDDVLTMLLELHERA